MQFLCCWIHSSWRRMLETSTTWVLLCTSARCFWGIISACVPACGFDFELCVIVLLLLVIFLHLSVCIPSLLLSWFYFCHVVQRAMFQGVISARHFLPRNVSLVTYPIRSLEQVALVSCFCFHCLWFFHYYKFSVLGLSCPVFWFCSKVFTSWFLVLSFWSLPNTAAFFVFSIELGFSESFSLVRFFRWFFFLSVFCLVIR